MRIFTPGRIVFVALLAVAAYGAYWWQQKNTSEAAKPKRNIHST